MENKGKQSYHQRHDLFKINKKLNNAVEVIQKTEQQGYSELFQKEYSSDLFIIHFGNGDEEDFISLKSYLDSLISSSILHIFPGISYGMVQCNTKEQGKIVMDDMNQELQQYNDQPYGKFVLSKQLIFGNKKRKILVFPSKIEFIKIAEKSKLSFKNAVDDVKIDGINVINNFINEEEEQMIIDELDKRKWIKLANRRIQHYGYEFIYGANNVDTDKSKESIPSFLQEVVNRINKYIQEVSGGKQQTVDQLTVNDYQPGHGIPPHYDSHSPFEEYFVSLSLGSQTVMGFKDPQHLYEKTDKVQIDERHLHVQGRDLMVFSGAGRYRWYHFIQQRKMDKINNQVVFRKRRVSLTFRKIRTGPCQCVFPLQCDTQVADLGQLKTLNSQIANQDRKGIFMDLVSHTEEERRLLDKSKGQGGEGEGEGEGEGKKVVDKKSRPSALEQKYVYEVYDKIAPHFSNTRHTAWPKIEEFLLSLEDYSLLADIGCGNGKYLKISHSRLFGIGMDRSEGLLKQATSINSDFQLFSGDGLKLSLRSDCMDNVISIAVVHHFSNREMRVQALKEMVRVVKKGGRIMVYVWAYEQEQRVFTDQDNFIPWNLQYKFEDKGTLNQMKGEKEKREDKELNTDKKTVVYKRYYHVFKKGELEDLFNQINGITILESFYDHANWVTIVQKNQ